MIDTTPHGGLPPKYNYSDDKLDATDSLRVDFTQKLLPSPQLFGFDARRKGNTYFKWAKNFEAIRLKGGQPYFVPYQSLGAATLTATNTQTEQVIANLKYIPKSGFDVSKLVFRLKDSTTPLVKTAINDSTYIVGLPAVPVGGTSGNEPCVYAYYTQGTTIKKIGKINISPLKRREEKVILVPVNGAIAPSVGVLQTYLDSVYRQANVRFTVTEKTGFRFNIDSVGAAGLARAGSGINKYSAEMRMLRDKFASDTTYDKKASYIFVVSAFEGGGLDGFMVRGRSMGFVASGASKRTYAHELGHGAFGLEHTFPEIGQSLSNNLMDYGDSTHLTHKQCKDISKRKFVFSLLDSEEDAALKMKKIIVYVANIVESGQPAFNSAEVDKIISEMQDIFNLNDRIKSYIEIKKYTGVNDFYKFRDLSNKDVQNHYVNIELGTRDSYVNDVLLPDHYGTGSTNDIRPPSVTFTDSNGKKIYELKPTFSVVRVSTSSVYPNKTFIAAFIASHETWHALLAKASIYLFSKVQYTNGNISVPMAAEASLYYLNGDTMGGVDHHNIIPNLNMSNPELSAYHDIITPKGECLPTSGIKSSSKYLLHEKRTLQILNNQMGHFLTFYQKFTNEK